ncbi:MAG: hypothetical protein ABIT01_13560 [Thermoanaerobaculia bacterium]
MWHVRLHDALALATLGIVLLGASPISAGQNAWTSGGPYGVTFSTACLVIAPSDHTVVYAGASNSGFFRSTDAAASWTRLSSFPQSHPETLAVHPSDPLTVYAAAGARSTLRSTNGGTSWSDISIPTPALAPSPPRTYALALDPQTPARIYAGTDLGMFLSTDAGASWAPINNGLVNQTIRSIAINPLSPSTIYASGTFVYKSTNGGGSWLAANTGADSGTVIVLDPVTPSTLFATVGNGVSRSMNGGASPWTQVLAAAGSPLAMAPSSPATLYAGIAGGALSRTTNSGATWNPTSAPSGGQLYRSTLAVDPSNADVVYVGDQRGFFKSTSGGASWSRVDNGMNAINMRAVAVSPSNLSVVYADDYHSTDGGSTWTRGQVVAQGGIATTLAVDPVADNVAYLGLQDANLLYKTTDRGSTWTVPNNGLGSFGGVIQIDPSNSSTVYVGGGGQQIYKTVDGGGTWFPLNRVTNSLALDPSSPSTLYVTTPVFQQSAELYRSTNGGTTWGLVGSPGVLLRAVDTADSSVLYGLDPLSGFSVRSTDSGGTWSQIGSGLPAFTSFAAIPSSPPVLLAGTQTAGVFRSLDQGSTWIPLPGLGNTITTSVSADSSGRFIHAATNASVYDFELAGTQLYTVVPCRLVDTRGAAGPFGGPSLSDGTPRTFVVPGACAIPSGAVSVAGNITIVAPGMDGDLRVFAAGGSPAPSTAISYRAQGTRANNFSSLLGLGGGLSVQTTTAGSTDFILDVVGYFR